MIPARTAGLALAGILATLSSAADDAGAPPLTAAPAGESEWAPEPAAEPWPATDGWSPAGRPPADPARLAARQADAAGPEIAHAPLERTPAGAPLTLQVQASDPSGVAAVWIRFRTSATDNFIARSLSLAGDGAYRVTIPVLPGSGGTLEYIVGARDRRGNLSEIGDADRPLRTEVVPIAARLAPAPAATEGTSRAWLALAALAALWLVARRLSRRERPEAALPPSAPRLRAPARPAAPGEVEAAFWRRLLLPLTRLSSDDQIDAIRILATRKVRHPMRGVTSFSAPYLMERLLELKRAAAQPAAARPPGSDPAPAPSVRAPAGTPFSGGEDEAAALLDSVFAELAAARITGGFSRVNYDHEFDDPQTLEQRLSEQLGLRVQPVPGAPGTAPDRTGRGR